MTTDNYKDAALKAVNLGNDTDTAAAITGGLAGLYYGIGNIPENGKMKSQKEQRSMSYLNVCLTCEVKISKSGKESQTDQQIHEPGTTA